MTKQIVGWGLVGLGVLIILWGIWSSFAIFTAGKPVPEIFKIEEQKITSPVQGKTPTTPQEIQEQLQNVVTEQFQKLIPPNVISKLLNLASWSIFTAILFFGGGKISEIGIKLLKKEKVQND